MMFSNFEDHLTRIGLPTKDIDCAGQPYMVVENVRIPSGSHEGELCEVAVRRVDQNPWLPEAQIHVRPHLTTMGQNASNPSPLGQDWQYLSRRFDQPPTPQTYYAFILTALGEL